MRDTIENRPATPSPQRQRRRSRSVVVAATVAAAAVAFGACSSTTTSAPGGGSAPGAPNPTGSGAGTTAPPSGYPLDDTLKLNQIQVLGSHNSYHVRTPQGLRDAIDKVVPGVTTSWNYEHTPLDVQFTKEGVRQIELDVHLDPDGRYATRHALALANLPADGPPELKQPGLKVFHIQELDFASTCNTFVACLKTVKTWSDANPGHVPLMILIEAKADKIPDPFNLNFSQPVEWDKGGLEQIDKEIRSVFDEPSMITPDQVRGTHKTLEEAVLAGGWPTLGVSRGKVLFTLDNDDLSKIYAEGHPSLEGRAVFTNAQPGQPDAAFVKRNSAVKDAAEIKELVKKGYVVRTLVDGDPKTAIANDLSASAAAFPSGAQWISTDYAVADPVVNPTYVVKLDGGTPARCNPVTAPPSCKPADIEDPAHLAKK